MLLNCMSDLSYLGMEILDKDHYKIIVEIDIALHIDIPIYRNRSMNTLLSLGFWTVDSIRGEIHDMW